MPGFVRLVTNMTGLRPTPQAVDPDEVQALFNAR